jgi:L-alanine-DL-glutamate epimerase-like enolase superfamily enzyme
VRNGMATLTEAPGFGMDIDWTEVERFRADI